MRGSSLRASLVAGAGAAVDDPVVATGAWFCDGLAAGAGARAVLDSLSFSSLDTGWPFSSIRATSAPLIDAMRLSSVEEDVEVSV